MKIIRRKKFIKAFEKLPKRKKQKVWEILKVFEQNPFEKTLNNHLLHGNLEGYRSISAGGDLRLIFEEREDYIVVVFITLGSRLGNLNIF